MSWRSSGEEVEWPDSACLPRTRPINCVMAEICYVYDDGAVAGCGSGSGGLFTCTTKDETRRRRRFDVRAALHPRGPQQLLELT